jgi:hypothetical protein
MPFLCRCHVVFVGISQSWCLYVCALLALLGSGSDENQNPGGHPSVFVCLLCAPEILIRFAKTSAFPNHVFLHEESSIWFHASIRLFYYKNSGHTILTHYSIGMAKEAVFIRRCSVPLGPQARTSSYPCHHQPSSDWFQLSPNG